MSYVAIARKWRPTRFEDIVGQGHVTRTLQNAIRLERVHHAFLFTGARGVGKTTCARVLARALNCEAGDGATPDPCGTCGSCSEIASGSASDVIEIDGASNNSVDDIRDLRDSVRYLPQRGRRKIYIVDEVHMLSRGAFNALLKTLEEPPAHVVFIFATTEPHKIPDTILSRVQRFDFKRIPMVTVVERLQKVCEGEGLKISEGGLRLIARAGEGSMRDSQSLLDRIASFAGDAATTEQVAEVLGLVDRALLYDMLEGVVRGEADRCLDAIDRVDAYGFDLSEFTSEMLELIRNATLVGLSPGSKRHVDVPEDELDRLIALAKDVSSDVLVRSFHVMLEVHEQVARAPRPRMVLEMAVARLVSIRPARGMDQLLERVELLQRRVLHQVGSGARLGRSSPANESEGDSQAPPRAISAPQNVASPPVESASVLSFRRGPLRKRAATAAATAPAPESAPAAIHFQRGPLKRASAELRPEAVLTEPIEFARRELIEAPRTDAPSAEQLEAEVDFERRGLLEAPAPAPPPDPSESNLPIPQFEGIPVSVAAATAEPEVLIPPMPLPATATMEQRLEALLAYLERGGARFDALALDTAFAGASAPAIRLVCPSEFKLRVTRSVQDHERVKLGLSTLLPEYSRLELQLRSGDGPPRTRREEARLAREARIRELTNAVTTRPLHQQFLDRFGARLGAVVPADEPPPLPTQSR